MYLQMYSRPLVVNCDWLSFSVKIDLNSQVVAPSGYRYEKLAGTNVYKDRYILYDKAGNKVMTFCCNPYSSVIPDNIATCQIANPFLYDPDVDKLVRLVHTFFNGYFNGVSRYDVCCDFCPSDSEFKTIRKLTSGAQYVSGKSEGSIFWHSESYKDRDVRMAHCLSWGSAASALKIKLYNKSMEIHADDIIMCEKPYILKQWMDFLQDVNKVWRLEFSWTDVNQLAIDGHRLSFEDCLSSDIMCRFFSEVKAKRFIIRMNQGRRGGHKNLDEIVPFLPFKIEGAKIRRANPMTAREPLSEERALARHLWMHMADRAVLCEPDRYHQLRAILIDMATSSDIWAYLDSLCDGSFMLWLKTMDESVGSGVFVMNDNRY